LPGREIAVEAVDIHRSPWRAAGLLAGSCAFVAVCVWMILDHPEAGRRAVTPERFTEGVACLGAGFFALCAALVVRMLLRRGPVVSVGPRGIFDRRLSTDWIPWTAIRRIAPVTSRRQRLLALEIDPAVETALPWTGRTRRVTRLNRVLGDRRYWMAAIDLRGGFPALSEAVERGWSESRPCRGDGDPVARRDPA
jgi:hypothetical protein